MRTLTRREFYNSSPEEVFSVLDDLGVTGTHMTNSSSMMMGSKLHLDYLTKHHTGLNSSYRWTGTMMGLTMDFTVKVVKWENAKEKVWETTGPTRLIIYSWYRMALHINRKEAGTEAELSITYEKPQELFYQILCFFFADWYCRWCLKRMLVDCKRGAY